MDLFIELWTSYNINTLSYLVQNYYNINMLNRIALFISYPGDRCGNILIQYKNNYLFIFDFLKMLIQHCNNSNIYLENLYINRWVGWCGINYLLTYIPDNYINKVDNSGFSLILDTCRYGSYNTFKVLINKTELCNLFLYGYKNKYHNILTLSIYNKDLRIFEYLYKNETMIKFLLSYNAKYTKNEYCNYNILKWIKTLDKRIYYKNLYKKICLFVKIMDDKTIVNDILYHIHIKTYNKLINKYDLITSLLYI